ncbi:transcriptional regulator STERILE APETALA [Syzygium oleosum]|uniref:transcriptional regulator STERILE APETALA n=1 Tax=Syzygium oleosum TaxID=219896 RepID=UPI0024BAC4D5|nr:transcriptional regulator STERILE APETALA [Syzygium oleosum]
MSSTSSSSEDGGGGGGAARRGGDYEGPSTSRHRRSVNEVWPEPFLEALAAQVAIDARSGGRLSVAPALVSIFRVCSTWRNVSNSDPLWARLTQCIWGQTHLTHPTWHDEFIFRHRTAANFRSRQSVYATLQFNPLEVNEHPHGLICRCLTLSDLHLACGFADGTVRLFDLATRLHVTTYQPLHQGGLGLHPRAVAGIIMSDLRLVFATLDGDIHVVMIDGRAPLRRAHVGDVVNDGALVDFAGCGRWWVGLYAGVPGRAFRIWDSNTEELVFVGGTLTDPEALMGWQMLTDLTQFVGRLRVTQQESAVAATSTRVIIIDLRDQGVVLHDRSYRRRGLIVTSVDVNEDAYIVVDTRGLAVVRHVGTSEEICRFNVRGASQGRVMGCMNQGYAFMCVAGVIRVWEVERGANLYNLAEGMGEVNALVANERHVAVYSNDATIHLWDFGAE